MMLKHSFNNTFLGDYIRDFKFYIINYAIVDEYFKVYANEYYEDYLHELN